MATPAIFDRLIEDHEKHRSLFEALAKCAPREADGLFTTLTKELKGHAAAEEQALYSTMMRKPPTTSETRHSVAEHHEIEEMLNDLAATDAGSDAWRTKFDALRHRYLHHIEEEEDDHFPDFAKHLTQEDEVHMRAVFDLRKREEEAAAEVTPEALEDAKE